MAWRSSKVLVLQLKYIHRFSDSYINVEAKLFGRLWNCKQSLGELNYIKLKRKLVGLLWHSRKPLIDMNKVNWYKLLTLNKRETYRHVIDTFLTYAVSTYKTAISIATHITCTSCFCCLWLIAEYIFLTFIHCYILHS